MLPSNWITASLGEVVKFASGGTPSRENASYWNGNIPWFSAKDLKRFQLLDSEEHITENGSQNGTRVVEPKTILILVRGMTLLKSFPVGMTTRHSAFNQDLRAVIPNDCLDREFLAYWLTANENKVMALVDQAGHGTGRLATDRLAGLDISFPSNLFEQQAIAHILSAWDRGIRQLNDLIAAKLRFKQGLMQQLLTGRRRFKEFKGQWIEHRLGDLFKEREETNRTDLPLLSITADRGVVPRQEIERKDTSSENKSLYKRIAPGDIGYNTMRMWQGVSAISSLQGIVSPAYTICIPQPAINAKFAAYLFKYPPVVHQFFRHSQGLVDDTLSLKFHHFAQINVCVPSVEEQLWIVEIFQSADREIDLLRKKLYALKTQKKGLMQKLLTGRVRVKVAPELKERGPKP